MDITTVIGVLASLVIVGTAIVTEIPNPSLSFLPEQGRGFVDITSILIVVIGTATVLFTANTPKQSLIGVVKKAFMNKTPDMPGAIDQLVGFSDTARREGILALESAVSESEIDDQFLINGIGLAVDGTEPGLIVDILETEIRCVEERHSSAADILSRAGDIAPAMGMIGTLVGLVLMLGTLDDPASIGPSMAKALLTTLYGALIANLFFIPWSNKVKTYSKDEVLYKQMILEGIIAIQSGDSPQIVKRKLSVFLAPSELPQEE